MTVMEKLIERFKQALKDAAYEVRKIGPYTAPEDADARTNSYIQYELIVKALEHYDTHIKAGDLLKETV